MNAFRRNVDSSRARKSDEIDWAEGDIFPNARLLQTKEQSLFFDSLPYMNALAASPVQCYLELQHSTVDSVGAEDADPPCTFVDLAGVRIW